MKAMYIITDGDFSLPLSDNLAHFGSHGYLLVTDDPHQSIYELTTTNINSKAQSLLNYYLEFPEVYVAYGNYSITTEELDGTTEEIIKAAKLLSPMLKD